MDDESYIRGAGPVRVDPGRVGRVLAVAAVLALAVCSVVLALVAASGDSGASSLRRHGVPVRAVVTSCTGVTSGIGMGAEYYQCRGTYTLGGRTYEAVIKGSRAELNRGTSVAALAIPGQPSSLAVPSAASSSSAGNYTASIVTGALAVLGAVALVARRRAGRPASAPA